jgi:hypothetical protein
MPGIQCLVVARIKPGAADVREPEARAPGVREGVDHELRDGFFSHRVRFVFQDRHPAVARGTPIWNGSHGMYEIQ